MFNFNSGPLPKNMTQQVPIFTPVALKLDRLASKTITVF